MDQKDKKPWYKYPMVWFVMALPLAAVIASFVTLYLAIEHAPVVLEHNISYKTNQIETKD